MQDDFLLLLTGNHVYSMHRLLLKSFQWWASGLHRFDELTPPLIPVSALFARVVQISWLMQHSMDITQRNVLLVSRHRRWVGQSNSRQPRNKTLLWVVSGRHEYSFDVGQVGDVDT